MKRNAIVALLLFAAAAITQVRPVNNLIRARVLSQAEVESASSTSKGVVTGQRLFQAVQSHLPSVVVDTTVADLATLVTSGPTANLSDGELVQTLGYHAVADGGGNTFRYDATSTVAVDGGFVIDGPGGVGRFIAINQTVADVRQFGARGDGSDDTAALQTAIATNTQVFLPPGVYGHSSTLTITNASVRGASRTDSILRWIDVASASSVYNVVVNGANITLDGFTIDGQVTSTSGTPSVDPVWSNANYDTWFGGRGLALSGAQDCAVANVHVVNCGNSSAIRVENSHAISIRDCVIKRTRGGFGDAMYISNSDDVTVTSCFAEDYTRIGFVCETAVTQNVSFVSCTATNGHDQSTDYGGGEFNAGFWAENSDRIRYSNCFASSTRTGFVVSASVEDAATGPVVVSYSNCVANANSLNGFVCNPVWGSGMTSATSIAPQPRVNQATWSTPRVRGRYRSLSVSRIC